MNQNKMLIDYITMFNEQLDELYKLLQTDINYDKKFEEFVQTTVLKIKDDAYVILSRLTKQTFDIDIKDLDNHLNTLLSFIDLGLSLKNQQAKQQLRKVINYSKVFENILLNTLPLIENEYYIASTLFIELLNCLDELIK